MENRLLPAYEPGLCFFLGLHKIFKDYQYPGNCEISTLFFLSDSFSFQYKVDNSTDIQSKYYFFDYEDVLQKLADNYSFAFVFNPAGKTGLDVEEKALRAAIARQKKVLLTVHLAALPYGQAEANKFRDDPHHCVRLIGFEQGDMLIEDDYVPDLKTGYRTCSAKLNSMDTLRNVKNSIILSKPRRLFGEQTVLDKIVNNINTFLNPPIHASYVSGCRALTQLCTDMQYVMVDDAVQTNRNLMGLLFGLKYQLYPGYYYLIDAVQRLANLEHEIMDRVERTNYLWKALFMKLEMLFIQPNQRQLVRLQNTAAALFSEMASLLAKLIVLLERIQKGVVSPHEC